MSWYMALPQQQKIWLRCYNNERVQYFTTNIKFDVSCEVLDLLHTMIERGRGGNAMSSSEAVPECGGKSVGAIIEREDGSLLMIERMKFPFGWACVAGHIDEGEEPLEALKREVREEVGLEVGVADLIFKGSVDNPCRRGATSHYWYVFKCTVASEEVQGSEDEVKNWKWLKLEELASLELEPVWERFLKQFDYIST